MMMTDPVNLLIIVSLIMFVLFLVFMKMVQAKKETSRFKIKAFNREEYTITALVDFISNKMLELTTSNLYEENLTEEQFKRKSRRREELKEALKNCNTGDLSSKLYVREYIVDLLKNEKKIDESNINFIIPFDTPSKMSYREKHETLLYMVGKKVGDQALGWIIDTFNLAEPKEDEGFRILEEEIDEIYKTIMKKTTITFEDKIRILSQIVYSHYLGFGVIDEIRDQNIDGVSGGVSGSNKRLSPNFLNDDDFIEKLKHENIDTSLNSVWIMYKGKTIHLSYLSFEHEAELRRVATIVYKYGYPGQLSESNPAIINDMYDASRVVVIRPKLSESWVFFIRKKTDREQVSLDSLYTQENYSLPCTLMKYFMKTLRTVGIIGPQFSGKTTLLTALIKYLSPALNLRVQETKFELRLRELFPGRNIVSFQETETYSGQDGLDLQKKTDGHVSILGEIATAPVAAWAVQISQVASLCLLFTHHANSLEKLVFSLRNALLNVGLFRDEKIAEQQVVSILEFNIHLRINHATGERFIQKITECIPFKYEENQLDDYLKLNNTADRDGKLDILIQMATKYFHQKTQTKQFVENTIIEYRDGKYVAVNPISEERLQEMLSHLAGEDQQKFKEFINSNWSEQSI